MERPKRGRITVKEEKKDLSEVGGRGEVLCSLPGSVCAVT